MDPTHIPKPHQYDDDGPPPRDNPKPPPAEVKLDYEESDPVVVVEEGGGDTTTVSTKSGYFQQAKSRLGQLKHNIMILTLIVFGVLLLYTVLSLYYYNRVDMAELVDTKHQITQAERLIARYPKGHIKVRWRGKTNSNKDI